LGPWEFAAEASFGPDDKTRHSTPTYAFIASATTGGPHVIRTILLILVILLLIGALPTWPYSAGWGYYPSTGLGTLLVIVIIMIVAGAL
jgi:hypothetical protein